MSKAAVFMNLTLGGVTQAPARPEEERRGGFQYGGWGLELGSRLSYTANGLPGWILSIYSRLLQDPRILGCGRRFPVHIPKFGILSLPFRGSRSIPERSEGRPGWGSRE
jgi:hypothetical protein